jgi:hypothetical protein
MLKFLHVARIFNFHIFLADFNPNFKRVVFSLLNELMSLQYTVGIIEISSFHLNFNSNKTLRIALDMSQIVYDDLVWYI